MADRPAHLLGLKPLRIKLHLLGDDLLDQRLGIAFVVDGELAGPGEAFRIGELVDVEPKHPREEGVERADPEVLDDLPVDATAQLALLLNRQGAPGLAELTLRQTMGQQQLQPLLHFPGGLVGERDGEQLGRINAVMADKVGNAMGQGPGLAAAGTGHHQQRPRVVIDGPALGFVETGQETHAGVWEVG